MVKTTSGRDALHRIDALIVDARKELSTTSADAASDARALASLDQRQIDLISTIASIRVDHLAHDAKTSSQFGEIDAQAERLIAEHDAHIEEINSNLQALELSLSTLEIDRRKIEHAHDEAISQHEAAALNTQSRLEKDETFQSKAAALEEANSIVIRARQKLQLAEEDRKKKGAAFENDQLFTYLKKREFGTKNYNAFFLFSALDQWIARLIKYRDHKLNYDRLLEIPERINDHVDHLEEKASLLASDLENYERKALEKDGVEKLRKKINKLHDQIKTLDIDLTEKEKDYNNLTKKLKLSISGDVGPLAQARALLSSAMRTLSIPNLKVIAAETETMEDDRLVDLLIRVRRERMELEANHHSVSTTLNRHNRRLSELEDIRRRFKGARFDSPYSEFSGSNIVGALLSEFLRGTLSRDDLWRRIERSHRTRRRNWQNDMGGDPWLDGFGLPQDWGSDEGWARENKANKRTRKRRKPIRIPRAPRGPRSPRIRFPKSGGGRKGGGFKTGGGF